MYLTNKLIRFLLLITLTLSSALTSAAIISYQGYTYDEDTNYVSGNGLDWLRWDITAGLTISESLALYSAQGFGLANLSNMQTLIDDFGWSNLDVYTSGMQIERLPDDEYSFGIANEFIALFGDTYAASGLSYSVDGRDPLERSQANFYTGVEEFGFPYLRRFMVTDEFWNKPDPRYSAYLETGLARLDRAFEGSYDHIPSSLSRSGIAMVRASIDTTPPPVQSVPAPPSSVLFIASLLVLMSLRATKS